MTITLDELNTTTDAVRRDGYGRYLVVPPDGGRPKGYTRATTVAKALEDQHSLIAWKARVAAKGLTIRPELLKMIAVEQDRKRLDDLVEQAAQAGGATERRDEGTALHRALELAMGGAPVPELFRSDVDAVHQVLAAHGLSVVAGMTERMCVLDEHTIAGTFDLIVKHGSTLYVADFKTGKTLDYSGLAFATQLAIYAHADALYTQGPAKNGSQDRRDPMPPVDRATALVIHVQPGSGVASVHDVDIARGRRLLDLALEVRGQRSSSKTLIAPRATTGTAATSQRAETAAEPPTPLVGSVAVRPAEARPATRREELAARLRALRAKQPAAMAVIAVHWPEGVPAWNSGALYSKADFDKIDALISIYESAADVPFSPVAQERLDEMIPSAPAAAAEQLPARQPPVFDEGGAPRADGVEGVRASMRSLEGDGRAFALRVLAEARDAGVPVGYGTERQLTIRVAIERWARVFDGDDELVRAALVHVVGDDRVQPGFPTGAVLGALTIGEAKDLYDACTDVHVGALVPVIDTHGTRLERAAA